MKKETPKTKQVRSAKKKSLGLVAHDEWLKPYETAIDGRHQDAIKKEKELTVDLGTLERMANGHHFYGLHRDNNGWVFREWAPNATAITLVGDFSNWAKRPEYGLKRIDENGVWELHLPEEALHHGDLYKMVVEWKNGEGERIPAYATRVVQDENTHIFSAQVWNPTEGYTWRINDFKPKRNPLLIYECHIGMAQDREDVGSYVDFRDKILPRIAAGGYNAIQIMAIQEHPYYGSFGYHVSNFFAASSRFGTPEELKSLVDKAHELGITVIMDIVHSHAVKNEVEGLARIAGDRDQYFYAGGRGEHPAWDSLCFDYGKNEVLHFLLSNCKYWMEEYRFDGFRFDGVTSMLYYDHGLGKAFGGYGDYYDGNEDVNAITYLTLANKMIHEINPAAITIAEEMSGMPGLALPFKDGGIGFDYRMAMGIPDYWIKTIKELKDEYWKPSSIWWELTNRRADEQTISYVESHDQALVGDKTVIFRLIDDHMYWHMMVGDDDMVVARGMALHKMLRLVTASTLNGGYLNFMGNEWGHPEWIDFPREGNGWSYKYARRQWGLVDDPKLKYRYLNNFDSDMIHLIGGVKNFHSKAINKIWDSDADQILAFMRGDLVFVFNFNPVKSFEGYGLLVPQGEYDLVLDSDNGRYGGFDNVDANGQHLTLPDPLYVDQGKGWLKIYTPARSAQVYRKKRGCGRSKSCGVAASAKKSAKKK
ncbi:MAG: alpha amylase C-terminal domain-containing protein [Muribaculaceae bacterium]|nr:alpha amylase C-terminal domain-containing protein [Muribaculaceae bacterium]